ncbi:hypothetical protein PIB30_071298 [Stylosanthes scabra]|uniref:Uncharacterized protein n=1 Tax=Stylosanthes scabra TaxID=79078 RepID=A0ABU6RNV5_9FABA|nr:hypothetical protein [Stylosanthes scabra]
MGLTLVQTRRATKAPSWEPEGGEGLSSEENGKGIEEELIGDRRRMEWRVGNKGLDFGYGMCGEEEKDLTSHYRHSRGCPRGSKNKPGSPTSSKSQVTLMSSTTLPPTRSGANVGSASLERRRRLARRRRREQSRRKKKKEKRRRRRRG